MTGTGRPGSLEADRADAPVEGFGRLWRRTYLVRLEHVRATPAEVTAVWRRFSEPWPALARSRVAGSMAFSAYDDDGVTVAQVQLLMRASDPVFELASRLGGHRGEDLHWQRTLRELAAHFGADGVVASEAICLDRRVRWSRAGNVWHNAAIRSALHALAASVRRRTLAKR